MKELLKQVLPRNAVDRLRQVRDAFVDIYAIKSYSQEGEDMVLRRVFQDRPTHGFYVDVGAYHPKSYSNTYFFYKRGWTGINIDATPNSMELFELVRPRDRNVEAAIARERREVTFYMYKYPNFNSADKRFSSEALGVNRDDSLGYRIGEQKMFTRTLREILEQYLPAGQRIDFLSVDVEGMDLEVLQSNDWQRFRPRYVLVECALNLNMHEVLSSEVGQFMIQQRYELFAKTCNTSVFRDGLDVLPPSSYE